MPVNFVARDIEFRANTYTVGNQSDPSVTSLADGGFVVTWTSEGQDGSGSDVYGQVYGSDGSPVGGEFRVNSHTESNQSSPSITSLADGGFVVTWQSLDQDGSGWGVYGQAYSGDGRPVGGEFRVNSHTESNQSSPSITGLADGGFVVTWNDYERGYGQVFSSDGIPIGDEFPVSTGFSFDAPVITGLADGGFVVVSMLLGGAYGQVFSSDGAPIGGEFIVRGEDLDSASPQPSITGLANGGFVVAYHNINRVESDIIFRVYGSDGSYIVGVRANTHTFGGHSNPSIASLADGGFVVTWNSGYQDGSGIGVYGQAFSEDGSPVGGEFRVNSHTESNQSSPSITGLADGGFVVTWQSLNQDGSGSGVYGQVFSKNFIPAGVVTISGIAREDDTLTAVASAIADDDGLGSFSYQWFANGTAILGATLSTFMPGQAQVDQEITVRVSYIDGHGIAESLISSATSAVENVNDAPTGVVTLLGTAREDSTLMAVTTGIDDADGLGAFSYQWFADGNAISGATASTFTPAQSQVGQLISVGVTYTDGYATDERLISAATTEVQNVNDAPSGTVTIEGTVRENSTLTAATSTIADADGLGELSYQWFANATAISGATSNTFTLGQAQVGQAVTVRVSYTDSYDAAEQVTSAETSAVQNVNDAPTGQVRVTGTPRLGQTLTADTTAVADPDGIDATMVIYQWLRDGIAISGATGRNYAVAAGDLGRDIAVRYSYTDIWGSEESLISSAVEALGNQPAVLLSPTDGRSGEDGSAATVSVMLEVAPVDPVTITFAVSDESEATLPVTSLTFTSANWNVAQVLTIYGVDDYDDDGNVAFNLTGTIATDDVSYTQVVVPTLRLINSDDVLDSDLQIYGDNEINYLSGNNGDDRLYGAGNLDELRGGRGDDRLYGEQDDDRLYGDLGNDWLYGGYDDDQLFGDAGDDELYGEAGADTLTGGDGNDLIDGGTGADRMSGNAGNDTYYVDNANDVVADRGLASDVDTVVLLTSIIYTLSKSVEDASLDDASGDAGLAGNNRSNGLTGNNGNNELTGGGGGDTLIGADGRDTLYAGDGDDKVYGGAGSDLIVGGNGAGNDLYRGGAGVDTIHYSSAAAGIIVNLATGTARSVTGDDAGIGHDRLFKIEAVIAGKFNDAVTGNERSNSLSGTAGDDRLVGQSGADTLIGGTGRDVLIGGKGKDVLTGGTGVDVFVFSKITETGTFAATRDVITDFQRGIDDIDLQAIDANTTVRGNQTFSFIGGDAFTGAAGQLRFVNGLVSGDVNGDSVVDFAIAVTGVTALASVDFIL